MDILYILKNINIYKIIEKDKLIKL